MYGMEISEEIASAFRESSMNLNLRLKLTVMMALEYSIWGAWSAVAGQYYTSLGVAHGFTGKTMGAMFSLMPLAMILSPFFVGHIADRWIHAEKLLGILHLTGAILLYFIGSQWNFMPMAVFMFVFALFFAPTVALTNAIAFHHLASNARIFSHIRVGGTIGWMGGACLLGMWRILGGGMHHGDLFFVASILAVVMGAYSFFLPPTPPKADSANPLAFLDALQLFKDRNFLIFMLMTFIGATQFDFYYIFGNAYLSTPVSQHGIGLSVSILPFFMSLSQVSEVVIMVILPWLLPKIGFRRGITLGMGTWSLRFFLLALFPIKTFAMFALLLHGICISFYIILSVMYVNEVAPDSIRASAQSLASLAVFGLGRYIGSFIAGIFRDMFTVAYPGSPAITDWRAVFVIPACMLLLCAILFPILFRDEEARKISLSKPVLEGE